MASALLDYSLRRGCASPDAERCARLNKQFYSNLIPGTLLYKRFVIKRCLHATEVGGVYLCSLKDSPGQEIALKVFSTEYLLTAQGHEQFEREVSFAFAFHHQNILRCFESFMDSDFAAFSMEYAAGGSLADYIQECGQTGIRQRDSTQLLYDLACSVEFLHRAGVYHRDLKPENVLLTRTHQLKLADFGIAAAQSDYKILQNSAVEGTVDYLCPEYIAEGQYDARSEIYAIGLIAYELVSGRKPFKQLPLEEALYQRVTQEITPIRHVHRRISRDLETVITRCLQRNPDSRYQSARELRKELWLLREFGCSNTSAFISQEAILNGAMGPLF